MFPSFPATMYSTSSYYWNSSTYSWVPKPVSTTRYYPNGAPHWNATQYYPTAPSIPNYSYSIPTAGYPMDPYSSLNQGSYYNYVNYYSSNTNIPNYYPAQLPGTMPTPPPTAPMTAAPVPPAPPAPTIKTAVPKIKKEPVTDTPPKCSNCQTTDPSKLRNANSKDNIMCHKCFIYRKINKKDRPTSKTVKKEIKRIKTE